MQSLPKLYNSYVHICIAIACGAIPWRSGGLSLCSFRREMLSHTYRQMFLLNIVLHLCANNRMPACPDKGWLSPEKMYASLACRHLVRPSPGDGERRHSRLHHSF
jgi:hypothetical protein